MSEAVEDDPFEAWGGAVEELFKGMRVIVVGGKHVIEVSGLEEDDGDE